MLWTPGLLKQPMRSAGCDLVSGTDDVDEPTRRVMAGQDSLAARSGAASMAALPQHVEAAGDHRQARRRVLVITTRHPFPPTGGDKLRIAQLCDILSEHYEVSLATLSDGLQQPPDEADRFASIEVFRQPKILSWLRCLGGLFRRQPLQLSYYTNPALRRYVQEHAHTFDAIVLHLIRSLPFLPADYRGRTFLEMTDCMTLHYDRASTYAAGSIRGGLYSLIEKARMRRLEAEIAAQVDAVTVISEIDREVLIALDPRYRNKIRVFPNYIRPLRYQPSDAERSNILFIGNMKALHVLDAIQFFADEVMPVLAARHPQLRLLAIGPIGGYAARRLGRHPNVTLLGPVDRIEEHVDRLLCGIAPMRFASGLQNKVIDYMALGVPALISTTALEGIPAKDREEVLVCDTAADYVDAVELLMRDRTGWERIAKAGQVFAHRTYGRDKVASQVLAAFHELLDAPR